ncbi:SLBB domain-containing protein [Undibacterium luofuense]|uniref:SLBB domain-containing protein n=1 Tax=Undibacterium luofuense TaxID=2828733 RepID=A0A941DJM8_9BURK|nr:SLBB domain-containing protein [Undibacterium luofuense]MBR7781983.1 SLBB domain-containing protein [Undibacterium luofuense]
MLLKSASSWRRFLRLGMAAGAAFGLSGNTLAQETEPLRLKLDYWLTAPVQSDLPVMPAVVAEVNSPMKAALQNLSNEESTETVTDFAGEGDQILITVFGQPDLSADVVVGSSGLITLPLIGTLEVKGKSAIEIAQMYARKLEQGQYLLNPKVAARIGQQVSRAFSVMGEVSRPGKFPIQGQISLLDAISIAGGFTQRADKQIRILRKHHDTDAEGSVETLSLNFDDSKNAERLMQRIRPNDVIVVGQQKNFYVYGEVRKPGMYPVEEDLNVMRVLAIGGGVSERGSSSRIRILRKNDKGEIQEISASIRDIVLPGDVVFVNERIF